MIYKEVLSSIPEEEFLRAGSRILTLADRPDDVTPREREFTRRYFRGLGMMATDIGRPDEVIRALADESPDREIKELLLVERSNMEIGAWRFTAALKEYFQTLINYRQPDKEEITTNSWLQNLRGNYMSTIAGRYIQSERDLLNRAEEVGGPTVSPEFTGTYVDYPAFLVFANAYHLAMEEAGVDSLKAGQITEGYIVGAVALREAVELTEFRNPLLLTNS